jgi:hypothetical protein
MNVTCNVFLKTLDRMFALKVSRRLNSEQSQIDGHRMFFKWCLYVGGHWQNRVRL